MSRYSRSGNSMRRIFLDEFLANPNRGKNFYERVLSEYGDDSVAELGLVQIGVEGLSNIAIQTVEDRRLGLSFLEKSSRYVFWDKKIDGHFAYYTGKDVMESRYEKAYTNSCELSFETYSKLTTPMLKYVEEVAPIESHMFLDSESNVEKPFSQLTQSQDVQTAQRIYRGTLRARTSDALRSLLPASTLTNVGIAGNGRAFEYLISVLKSSPLREVQKLGNDIYNELTTTAGAFVKRAGDKYGAALQKYMVELSRQSDQISLNAGAPLQHCTKMPFYTPPEDALNLVISGLLYENSHRTFSSLYSTVKDMPKSEKRKIIKSFANLRHNRRHRPPRAFELVSYTFDLVHNYGMFRDMHRHRVLTMQRQPLSTRHGFTMPDDIIQAGFSKDFRDCMSASQEAYHTIHTNAPLLSQYVVNFAYNYPYMLKVNLRELCHIVELRTLPQGHSDYRNVTQNMYRCIQRVHPDLAEIIKFVNLDRYDMGRMGSETRSAAKRKKFA